MGEFPKDLRLDLLFSFAYYLFFFLDNGSRVDRHLKLKSGTEKRGQVS